MAVLALVAGTPGCGSDSDGGSETGNLTAECALIAGESCYLKAVERARPCLVGFSGELDAEGDTCVDASISPSPTAELEPALGEGLANAVDLGDGAGTRCFRYAESGSNRYELETAEGVVTFDGGGTTLEIGCEDGTGESISAAALQQCEGGEAFPTWSASESGGVLRFGFGNAVAECRSP